MAYTRVDCVNLTVTTVDVFIETMQFIHENGLWDEVGAYLKSEKKTEMFIDHDAFNLLRESLKQSKYFDPENRTIRTIIDHK